MDIRGEQPPILPQQCENSFNFSHNFSLLGVCADEQRIQIIILQTTRRQLLCAYFSIFQKLSIYACLSVIEEIYIHFMMVAACFFFMNGGESDFHFYFIELDS